MKNSLFTVHKSTIESNFDSLFLLLESTNRLHLFDEIENKTHYFKADDNGRVPLNLVTEDIDTVAAITQESNLGLKVVNMTDLEKIPLYKTIQHAINIIFIDTKKIPLHILLKLLVRYFSVISEVVTLAVEEHQDKIIIKLIPNMPDMVSLHQIEGVALGIYRILNKFNKLNTSRIQFCHDQPSDDLAIYQDILKIKPEFNQQIDSLEFSIQNNESDDDEQTYQLMSSLQNLMNLEFPHTSYSQRCRHVLKCILSLGTPKREKVAKVFNLSISSLQRRLKEEGTSFKDVLLATRKELAYEYLVVQKRSVNDAAFLLGYQFRIQFIHAFKNWFDLTPTQYIKTVPGKSAGN